MKTQGFFLAILAAFSTASVRADCPKFSGDFRLTNRGCMVVDASELSQAQATPGHAMEFPVTTGSVSIQPNQAIRVRQMLANCSGFLWSRLDENGVYTTEYPKSGEITTANGWFESKTRIKTQLIGSTSSLAYQVKTTDRKVVPYSYPVPMFDLFVRHPKPYWENEVATGSWTVSPERDRLTFQSQTKTIVQGEVNMRQHEVYCEFERIK